MCMLQDAYKPPNMAIKAKEERISALSVSPRCPLSISRFRARVRFCKTAKDSEKRTARVPAAVTPRPVQLYPFARSYKVRSALYPSLITHAQATRAPLLAAGRPFLARTGSRRGISWKLLDDATLSNTGVLTLSEISHVG